jgi:hypothetical protein
MPMFSSLVNIISLPYQGQTNQIRETIITKIHCYSKRTHKLNLVLRFIFFFSSFNLSSPPPFLFLINKHQIFIVQKLVKIIIN